MTNLGTKPFYGNKPTFLLRYYGYWCIMNYPHHGLYWIIEVLKREKTSKYSTVLISIFKKLYFL